MLRHVEGTAGEDGPCFHLAAMVTSSTGGLGPSKVTTCLVGKGRRPTAAVAVRGSTRRRVPAAVEVVDRVGASSWRLAYLS